MNRGHRNCEICGIQEKQCSGKVFFARFPSREHICKQWVKVVGKEDLIHLPIEKLHDLRYICGRHFSTRQFTKTKTRLKKTAVPTLQLTMPPLPDEVLEAFPLHMARKNQDPVPVIVDPIPAVPMPEEQPSASSDTHKLCDPVPVIVDPVPAVPMQEEQPSASSDTHKLSATVTTVHAPAVQKSRKRPLATSGILNIINDPEIQSTSAFISGENVAKRIKLAESDLNPKEKELLGQLKKTKATVRSLKKSITLMDSLQSTLLKDIVTMALKNQKRKPRGRRYTTQSKISLLAIYKRSPKAYRYLRHLMPLPSESTLTGILKKIPMEPGLCGPALEHLKKHLPKNAQDKHCTLLFDEIALKPRLIYNNATDKIEGFTDMGNGERSPAHADHALVFMLQGLRTNYKQPIAFYFVKGTVSSHQLATVILKIIKAVNETGFNIMSTICDQGPTNMGALKILKELTQSHRDAEPKNYFKVDDKKIYIVYDVPHLFKSIRNNFMNNGAMRLGGDTAKWEHLLKVEEMNRNLLYLSKITPVHVQPKYRAKMKVKYAAQLLSHTVYAVLMLLARDRDQDPTEAEDIEQTGRVVLKLDRLFNYTNGPSGPDDIKRGIRENVSTKTNHVQVWAEYRKLLETVSFINRRNIKANKIRCIEGYKTTLCSLRDIWAEWQRLGFKYLNLRQLNQDALENLFGVLRQHSPTNRHPTVAGFIAALKTAIVSKMTAPHSRGSNCQKDFNSLLTDFHDIVFDAGSTTKSNTNEQIQVRQERQNENIIMEDNHVPVLSIPEEEMFMLELESDIHDLEIQPVVYISGYIAHCLLKDRQCDTCKESLTAKDIANLSHEYEYIKLREWWNDRTSLTYPSKGLYNCIEQCKNVFELEIVPVIHSLNIRQLTVTMFMAQTNNTFIMCNEHRSQITNIMMVKVALLLIRRQCAIINKKIAAEEQRAADVVKKSEQINKQ